MNRGQTSFADIKKQLSSLQTDNARSGSTIEVSLMSLKQHMTQSLQDNIQSRDAEIRALHTELNSQGQLLAARVAAEAETQNARTNLEAKYSKLVDSYERLSTAMADEARPMEVLQQLLGILRGLDKRFDQEQSHVLDQDLLKLALKEQTTQIMVRCHSDR